LLAKPPLVKGPGRGKKKTSGPPTPRGLSLEKQGVDKHLAQRARKAANMTAPERERYVVKIKRLAVAAAEGDTAVIEEARAERYERFMKKRQARLDEIAAKGNPNPELALGRRFPIIYGDPPWRYENPPMGDSGRSIENHFPTMTLDEICALPVADLATDDAILYMWATAPKLAECMEVIKAWGFVYRTCAVWDKEIIGPGYYFRNQHELLLVSTRGKFPKPLPGTQPSSVYRERRGAHSAKPDFFRKMIETLYPDIPKIELFAREAHGGWAAWGNEVPEQEAAE
jgi:N6-adenosine-specific RNA methylase IME4